MSVSSRMLRSYTEGNEKFHVCNLERVESSEKQYDAIYTFCYFLLCFFKKLKFFMIIQFEIIFRIRLIIHFSRVLEEMIPRRAQQ
jgi:hypothetical protein